MKEAVMALAAALAVAGAGFGTALAQSRIGSAGAGAIAEKPETAAMVIVLEALPETIVLFGFVIAIQIIGKM
ncbi:MAG: ATPase [Actinomycetota bacterium]|nr:ATPase [Actinomycetota bacterium]